MLQWKLYESLFTFFSKSSILKGLVAGVNTACGVIIYYITNDNICQVEDSGRFHLVCVLLGKFFVLNERSLYVARQPAVRDIFKFLIYLGKTKKDPNQRQLCLKSADNWALRK